MVILQNTTQKKFWIKSLLFVCVTLFLYFLTTSFAHAADGDLGALDKFMLGFSLGVGGFVAGLGGVLFDMAIDNFALQMGHWFINRGVGAVVTSIWTMIRDLFNILFIFSLVYIGLRTIWDADDSRTKKMLGMLIAAALLINFSLYIAKVVVDIANFTTVQIYQTATEGIEGQYGLGITIEDSVTSFLGAESSISGAYMEVLNVSSWFDDNVGTTGNVFVYSIFALFFLMFLGLVLAYGAIMLVARFIAIIFYLMFSPLMFLGWVLPQFQKYATKWWKGFLGYSFFAPVYVFMLYIGLYSLQQIRVGLNISHNNSFSKTFTGETFTIGNFEIFLLFTVGVGFLIAATKVASAMSSGGAAIGMNMADKFGRKFTVGMGTRLGKYGAGYAASASSGWAARKIGDGMDARSAASSKPRGRIGRSIRSGVLRGETAKFGGSQSSKERKDADKDEIKRHSVANAAHLTQKAITDGAPSNTNATPAQRIAYEKAIQKVGKDEVLALTKTGAGKNSLLSSAADLSEKNIKEINESADVSNAFKAELNKARQVGTAEAVGINSTTTTSRSESIKKINDADKGQLKDIGLDNLMEGAKYLQDSQMSDLKDHIKDGTITKTQFKQLKEKRKQDIQDAATAHGHTDALNILNTRKGTKEIAKLPERFLESLNFINAAESKGILTPALLKSIADNSDADTREIGRKVRVRLRVARGDGSAMGQWLKSGIGLQF